jgi:hypothetical protein
VSQPTITKWRTIAGITKGFKPGGTPIPDSRRKISPKEAAGIVLQALWEPYVKQLLGDGLAVGELNSANLKKMFNAWAEKAADPKTMKIMETTVIRPGLTQAGFQVEAEALLKTIYASRGYTYGEIHKDANRAAGKKIPRSTIRGWVQEVGGLYLKDDLCPWQIAGMLLMRASEEATPSPRSSESSPV